MGWPVEKPPSGIPASGVPASGTPATGTSVAPFHQGNLEQLRHGARSPRVYGDLAQNLAYGLLEEREDLLAFPEAVAAWAEAEARAALMRQHLEKVDMIDPETKEPRTGVLQQWHRFEKLAAQLRRPLGLDPQSDAELKRTRAEVAHLTIDIAGLVERGKRARARWAADGDDEPQDMAGEVLDAHRSAYDTERAAQREQWITQQQAKS